MISSNHHATFVLPRYQSTMWKQSIRSAVVRVLRPSRQDNKYSGSTIASTRGAVTSNHQCGAGLYTLPGSTWTPYLSHERSAVMHRAICTGSRSKLNGPNAMLQCCRVQEASRWLELVHSSNLGHGAFVTPGDDNFPEWCPPGGLQTVPWRNKSSRLLP